MAPASALLLVIATWFTLLMSVHCVTPDTFFCLVIGRSVVEDGLPYANTLTAMNAGGAWIDQQWLAHWLLFRSMQVGGFPGLLFVRWLFTMVACGLALTYAAERKVSPLSVLLAGTMGLALVLFKAKLRAQMFAEPLFVGLCWLLAEHVREGLSLRRRALLLALLVLWANLHGSILLAVLLVWLAIGIRFVASLRRGEGARSARITAVRADAALAVLAFCSIFASPYAAELPKYYLSTVGNPLFQQYLAEWRSTGWGQGSFMIVIGTIVAVLLFLHHRAMPRFELLVLIGLLALSFYTVRYTLFFGLALLCFGPSLFDRSFGLSARLMFEGASLRIASFVLGIPAALFGLLVLSAYDSALAQDWPPGTAEHASKLAGPNGKVFAMVAFADRLLWERPELAGRVAFDARFELLNEEQFEAVHTVAKNPDHPLLREYDLFLLETAETTDAMARGFERVLGDQQAILFRRAQPQVRAR